MSWRLARLNMFLRWVVRPKLAATRTPDEARRDFDLFAPLALRAPPNVLHLTEPGTPELHWVSVGRCLPRHVILHFFGGAYISGSPRTHRSMLGRLSSLTGLRVAIPAYRLAPGDPAPAQFDDARAAHAHLLQLGYPPENIILGGDSAGGGLALALLADLCARDLRPAALYAISPWTDLTLSGDSLITNADREPLLPVSRVQEVVGYVLGDVAADDARVSPLFAEFRRPPPVQIHVGTTEILLDDACRMADRLRASGGRVELRCWENTPHAWPIFDGYVPEARQTLFQIAEFIRQESGVPAR